MSHSKPTTRRRFLASIPAVAATLTPAAAGALSGLAPQPADPIYAAIERCRAAITVSDFVYAIQVRMEDQGARPGRKAPADYEKACDDAHDAFEAMFDIHNTLFATEPTTVAGLHAFLDYAEEVGERLWDNWEADAFATVAAAVRSLMPAIERGAQS